MKIIDSKLYLEFDEMVECGVSGLYLRKAKSSGVKCWRFINDPIDNRRVLIDYEELKPEYKQKVTARYGNPYDMMARQPILNGVANSPEAHDFFLKYRYGANTALTMETVNKYTRADAWLRYINRMGLAEIKAAFGGMRVPDFYLHVGELIRLEIMRGKDRAYEGICQLPGDFPASYQRLKARAENYRNGTYEDLINAMYGNKKAAKMGKTAGGFDPELEDRQMAVIRAIAAKHNNFDAAQVKIFADVVFRKNGWETIGRSRIYQILQENKALLTPGRRGKRAYHSQVAMQVKRTAPKCPTYYFTVDGWTAELLYQENGTYNNRLVIAVVLDPFGKYPIGYAIGERECAELNKLAMRNALEHLRHLFGQPANGGMYAAWQVQSDNYAIRQMTPFYQAAAHLFTPAEVGNAKSKVIEPYFKELNKKYCQTQPNWSGFNITASKENQVNSEFLNLIKKTFPDRDGVERQLHEIMAVERRLKAHAYMQAWAQMPESDRYVIHDADRIRLFGQALGAPNSITGQGIVKQIDGVRYTYDSFDPLFRQNLHLPWQLIVDSEDTSQVLAVSPDEKLRFVLQEKMGIPMDIRSTRQEHHDHLTRVRAFNKANMAQITQRYAEDAEIVEEVLSNTPLALDDRQEADLKLMFTYNGQQKEKMQDAKGLIAAATKKAEKQAAKADAADAKTWKQQQQDFLKNKTNFNQYLD